MAASVKISINDEIATVLERVKRQYPTLDTPELFKLSLAEFDRMLELRQRRAWADSLPELELTDAERDELSEALSEADRETGEALSLAELKAKLKESVAE